MNDYISTIIETLYFIVISCSFYSKKINPLRAIVALIPILSGIINIYFLKKIISSFSVSIFVKNLYIFIDTPNTFRYI